MKRPFSYLLRLLLLLASTKLIAADVMRRDVDDNTGIAIDQVGVLVYPPMMLYNGVNSGEVRAVISIGVDGSLSDFLITCYTEKEFADAAAMALKRWKYEPARVQGRPRAARAEVLFSFRDRGVIVQNLPGGWERKAVFSSLPTHFTYQPCQLRELDRIPTPVHVISPVINSGKSQRSIAVEFYIDEKGRVRMPAVAREYVDDDYAAAAVAAVEQWRFEPPQRKGKAVLVYAQQEFNFRPKE